MLKTLITAATATTVGFLFFFTACSNNAPQSKGNDTTLIKGNEGEDMVKRGEHLVTIAACHDCHTPKK
ncbi:MAG: hypothetical protein M3342_06720 [Bacteroidota bacterium]|nr:hypothetical protein [Bacteroidota bacterium]